MLFSDLPGWAEDDHEELWRVFRESCAASQKKTASFRKSGEQDEALRAVCEQAARLPAFLPKMEVKEFFEKYFEPEKLKSTEKGLMTGYYEPEFPASKTESTQFSIPVLRRPLDLIDDVSPQGYPDLKAARKLDDGKLAPFPDRKEIEEGALKKENLEIFWMKDPFDLFTLQVQGSGRLRLEDGNIVRLAYDGRNGQPYTSIGKVLIDRGILKRENVSMQAIGKVFKKDPALARDVMQENKSYVFFRVLKEHNLSLGPLGGQGLALTPFRSIAVDHTLYAYGLPFFVDGILPGKKERIFRHAVIAQDTGTAIKGDQRIDLFTGWGEEAANLAGSMQQRVDVYLLRPKDRFQ
jgi:membrane-bound lytic murein transglycosylase A